VAFGAMWVTFLLMLPMLLEDAAIAGEIAEVRAKFDACDHHLGPAKIWPREQKDDPEVRFFILADIEQCDGSLLTTVQHVVLNLHADSLNFVWEDLNGKELGGGLLSQHYPTWIKQDQYDAPYQGHLQTGRIKYGANTKRKYAPSVGASFYPPPQIANIEEATVLAQRITVGDNEQWNARSPDAMSVELQSHREAGKSQIVYSLERSRDDIVIALGQLADSPIGDAITTTLAATAAPLYKLINGEVPAFVLDDYLEQSFIVLDSGSDISKDIVVPEDATDIITSHVVILSSDFEPIATGNLLLFSP
jgi:hypothetical protein